MQRGNSTNNFRDVDYLVLEGTINNYFNIIPKNERNTVVILWDIHTCPVPEGKSTIALIAKIRKKFITDGYKERVFSCIFDVDIMPRAITTDLVKSKIMIEPTEKNETFTKLKEKVKENDDVAITDKRLVVISNYVNSESFISHIKCSSFLDVVLVYNDEPSKAILEYKEAGQFHFKELTKSLPDVEINELKISEDTDVTAMEVEGETNPKQVHFKTTIQQMIPEERFSSDLAMSVDIDTDNPKGIPEFLTYRGDGCQQPTNWKRGTYIGSGGFGKVYDVENGPSNNKVAVKQVTDCQHGNEKEKVVKIYIK